MSRRKVKRPITAHSSRRFKERTGIEDLKEQEQFVKSAIKRGISSGNLKGDSGLKNWLENKSKLKRVKLYKGFVVVVSKTSNKCYTVYKIPREFEDEYEQEIRGRKRKKSC